MPVSSASAAELACANRGTPGGWMCELAGAIIAAATDITFNLRGYVAVLANDVLTSLYLIMVKNTPVTNGLSTTGTRAIAGSAGCSYPPSAVLECLGGRPRAGGLPAHVRQPLPAASLVLCLVPDH